MVRTALGWLFAAFLMVLCISSTLWHIGVAQSTAPEAVKNLTMLWLLPTALSDFGYSYSIDRGRQLVEEELNVGM